MLKLHGIVLDFGRVKNPNKNPVAEKAVQELEKEFLRNDPSGSAVSSLTLQLCTDNLNSMIRDRGLSAKEILLQREQYTGKQIELNDALLSQQKKSIREKNHAPSASSKARGKSCTEQKIVMGDLVFIKSELKKDKARDRYIVVGMSKDFATIQKLTNDKLMSIKYEVPISYLFKALPSGVTRNPREIDNYHDNDGSSDDEIYYNEPSAEPAIQPEEPVDDNNEGHNEVEAVVDEPTSSSGRLRRQPDWLRSGEWDTS